MGSNFSVPWPLLRPEPQRVAPLSDKVCRRIAMYGALVASGATLERLLFARLLIRRGLLNETGER